MHLQDEANTPFVCQQCAEQLAIHRQDALVECVWHATPAACARALQLTISSCRSAGCWPRPRALWACAGIHARISYERSP